MIELPTHGMVLAAGLGLRMRPITENLPKPLVPLAGRTLLDRALDHLQAVEVTSATVNLHYLGQMIEDNLATREKPKITYSWESDLLLETGGGVSAALPTLGKNPFYVVNADIAWEDGSNPALSRLADFWRDDAMDALLLLHPVAQATGYDGVGDYRCDSEGLLTRRRDAPSAPFVFTGVQLLHPRLFTGAPGGPFSLTQLYDEAEAAGRLCGVVHDGAWHHIGTPAGLVEAEKLFGSSQAVD
ncbi:MAG: NTP transferase domain-containing protein [Alphaproteobacteria bacterium]|nr:NTP transferase domain-containing protein [Alphaproteobacteria bacterium]